MSCDFLTLWAKAQNKHLTTAIQNGVACDGLKPKKVILQEMDDDLLLRTYDAGADDCLMQPMDNRLLLAIVDAWLKRAQMSSRS